MDPQGAIISNANVAAKHDQTQAEHKTIANDEGSWNIPSIPNGTYTVTVAASGFKMTAAKEVKVDAGNLPVVNALLQVGTVSEQVTVTGGA